MNSSLCGNDTFFVAQNTEGNKDPLEQRYLTKKNLKMGDNVPLVVSHQIRIQNRVKIADVEIKDAV